MDVYAWHAVCVHDNVTHGVQLKCCMGDIDAGMAH